MADLYHHAILEISRNADTGKAEPEIPGKSGAHREQCFRSLSLGLHRYRSHIFAALIVLLAIAVAVLAALLGLAYSKQHTNHLCLSATPSSRDNASSISDPDPARIELLPRPPCTNNTILPSPFTHSAWFKLRCNTSFPEWEAFKIHSYSFDDCLALCERMNRIELFTKGIAHPCGGILYRVDMAGQEALSNEPGNCRILAANWTYQPWYTENGNGTFARACTDARCVGFY
ncbi:hypothetical protein BDV96DRAFT_673988 [Lophiotrema nucula]|uniref:Uncharacterized protein n=1 Tax=Lophiotrema nucula TaxID=690887 RepID=A0A6A5ZJS3_9PLEO|nr:hypothetical protein BDV96DRAFT_673988 [Lophiotrema nucula]